MSGGKPTSSELFVLEHARLNRGLSRRQVADEIGISQMTYRRVEEGLPVHPASAKKIADYFGVQVTDLMPATEVAA